MTSSAISSALGFALLYAACIIPTARIALTAAAGFTVAVAFLRCGAKHGAAVFLITAVLGILMLPLKSPALLYASLLGYYPLAKSGFERIHNPFVMWTVKLLLFNVIFIALYEFTAEFFAEALRNIAAFRAATQIIGNAVFVLYDVCLSRLTGFYISRFSKYI